MEETTFSIEVNGTPKPNITLPTGLYRSAAAAVPALLGIEDFPVKVRIWVEELQPDYPPLMYRIGEPGGAAVQDFSRTPELRHSVLDASIHLS